MNLASEIGTKRYSKEFNDWLSSVSNAESSAVSFNVQGLDIGFFMSSEKFGEKLSIFASGKGTGRVSIYSTAETEEGTYVSINDCISRFLEISTLDYDLMVADTAKGYGCRESYKGHPIFTALYDFLYLLEVKYKDRFLNYQNNHFDTPKDIRLRLFKGEAYELYSSIMRLIDSKNA